MITYKEWKREQDNFGDHGMEDRQDWLLVPVNQCRDSGPLNISNFRTALEMLGGEQEDRVEVHRFGHWAVGWTEIILIAPLSDLIEIAGGIESVLDNYPVLDEEDFSELEYEQALETWGNMCLQERIDICNKWDVCFLQARFDNRIPVEINSDYLLY